MALTINPNLDMARMGMDAARQDGVSGVDLTKMAKERDKVKKLAQDFESLFLNMVMHSMRSTVGKSELMNGGNAEDIYNDMLDQEYSKVMASQHRGGLADNIEQFMLRSIGQDKQTQEATKMLNVHQGLAAYGDSAASPALQSNEKEATMIETQNVIKPVQSKE